MLDSEDSTVTYTEVSSPFEDLSDIGSPRVDGLPMMPQDPYTYLEAALQAPPSIDYEEEEYLALADSVLPPIYRVMARKSIRAQTLISLPSETEILSPPLPISSPPLPASPTYLLGYRAMMIQLRAESPSTSHSPPPIVLSHTKASMAMLRAATPSTYILAPQSKTPPSGTPPLLPTPLPASSLPLLLPSTDCRVKVCEVTLPPRKRLCIALSPRFEVGESLSAPTARPTGGFRADYGFVGTLDYEIRRDPEREVGLSQKMIDFVTTIRHDTDEIYERLDDAHDDRLLMSGQLNMLRRDRHVHDCTARLIESEARLSQNGTKKNHISSPATTTTTTTPVTNAQLKALIDQGVADGLAARDANRSRNGEDSHDSRTGVRIKALPARECTYQDFMKCKPVYFKVLGELGPYGVALVWVLDMLPLPYSASKLEAVVVALPNPLCISLVMASSATLDGTLD
nr:hypothetical protein [Tanacetum cinerariifolium]